MATQDGIPVIEVEPAGRGYRQRRRDPRTRPETRERFCPRCGTWKHADDYYFRSDDPLLHRQGLCRDCHRAVNNRPKGLRGATRPAVPAAGEQ